MRPGDASGRARRRWSGGDDECTLVEELVDAVRSNESRDAGDRGASRASARRRCSSTRRARRRTAESSAPRAWSPRWSWRSPVFISCARRCSIGSTRLPAPQRQALEIVFGLSAGAAPDRFLVGLAVLSLLSEAAEERPLLCVVDDAQWLDQASALTLAFVARRLLAEPVGIVFAAREPGEELRHAPELEVRGLRNGDARALLLLGGAASSWTSECATGSSPRRAGIRWRCWSCRAD